MTILYIKKTYCRRMNKNKNFLYLSYKKKRNKKFKTKQKFSNKKILLEIEKKISANKFLFLISKLKKMFSLRNSYYPFRSFNTLLYKSRFHYTYQDTIFALSSGLTKAGVSVNILRNQWSKFLGCQSEWQGCI